MLKFCSENSKKQYSEKKNRIR